MQNENSTRITHGMTIKDNILVRRDDKQSVFWYQKSAEIGDAKAQFMLGLMYELGRGVARDEKLAAHWYLMAAEQGHTDAQFMMASYTLLAPNPEHYCQACIWYHRAASFGHIAAAEMCKILLENKKCFANQLID
ncbi:MAG: sel1 repeat family protein [Magnetococcales bacterium]|nr:sel1 repeat family protein [Magnetococcales bacterium]